MAAKRPARASLRYAKAPLSPRYQRELHQLLGHCSPGANSSSVIAVTLEDCWPRRWLALSRFGDARCRSLPVRKNSGVDLECHGLQSDHDLPPFL